MGRLTGGQVKFSERRNLGNYEHRDIEVACTFVLDEGEDFDSYMDGILADIRARVQAEVAGKPLPVVVKKAPLTDAVKASVDAPAEDDEPVAVPKKRGRKAKAEKEPEPDLDDEDDEPSGDEPEGDEDDFEDEPAKEEGVSDADLLETVKTVNAKIKNGTAIRELLKQYGCTAVIQVPKGKRDAFLTALKKLKPKAA